MSDQFYGINNILANILKVKLNIKITSEIFELMLFYKNCKILNFPQACVTD